MLRPWKPHSHNHEPMLKLYQLHSGSCRSKALCHAKHGYRGSSQELVPPSWLCQGSTTQALRSLRSKQYAANVIDYDHAQNKPQVKAMLNLSAMLVSVEHQYTLMSSSAGNAGKITSPSDKQKKAETWPCKEVLNMHVSWGSARKQGVSAGRSLLRRDVQNGMEKS